MGISYEKLSPVAQKHGVTLLYGAPRLSEEGRLSICQFVIGPDGLPRGFYDKMHLAHYGASMEKDYFSAGEHLSVFRVKGLSFAPLICYDLRFPELASTLALQHSVDAVLHAVAFYRDESFHSWHAFAVARAMENQFYWLSLNRAGTQFGGSIFCQPWVDEDTASVTLGLAEELVWFEVDTAVMARVRAAYTFGRDRLGNYATIPVNQA